MKLTITVKLHDEERNVSLKTSANFGGSLAGLKEKRVIEQTALMIDRAISLMTPREGR